MENFINILLPRCLFLFENVFGMIYLVFLTTFWIKCAFVATKISLSQLISKPVEWSEFCAMFLKVCKACKSVQGLRGVL